MQLFQKKNDSKVAAFMAATTKHFASLYIFKQSPLSHMTANTKLLNIALTF